MSFFLELKPNHLRVYKHHNNLTVFQVLCQIGVLTEDDDNNRLGDETLESKFMEFSFAEKHLLPSVPMFITGSCFLGGAITTLLCWKFFPK
ncbi:hypothetical protein P5673_016028 [Acropora cervicornis]|uniref:Uncharacterized protein n=1 Tax=Acropora cervicornis TaxID=6130 RepID=A0AAD9V4G6_ACRCE|nr:hypothetical protein P5673_016028 [Acropora cervicornis]